MFTIGTPAFHVEEELEQNEDVTTDAQTADQEGEQDHQHYHVLRTSGKVPAGFLHYLTSSLNEQGYEVLLISEEEG